MAKKKAARATPSKKSAPRKAAKPGKARAKPAKRVAKPAKAASKGAKKPATKPKKAAKKPSAAKASGDRIIVENVNVPGFRTSVDAVKYAAMRDTLMAVLPQGPPGLTQTEMMDATSAKAPAAHFPGGEKSGWWTKCVQLDLEAKGAMKRSATKPIRWWRA